MKLRLSDLAGLDREICDILLAESAEHHRRLPKAPPARRKARVQADRAEQRRMKESLRVYLQAQ